MAESKIPIDNAMSAGIKFGESATFSSLGVSAGLATFWQAYIQKILMANPTYYQASTVIVNCQPQARGTGIISTYTLENYNNTGFPEYLYGIYFGLGNKIYQFSCAGGVYSGSQL